MTHNGSPTTDEPEGFRVPLHQSMTMHHLMLGVPRTLCIVIWTFCIALSLPLHSWYAIPLCLFIHLVSARAAKKDPQFWDVVKRTIQFKTFYRV